MAHRVRAMQQLVVDGRMGESMWWSRPIVMPGYDKPGIVSKLRWHSEVRELCFRRYKLQTREL